MSNLYIQYPQNSGGSGTTGSQLGVPYVVGPLDGAAKNAQGGVIGSYTFYQQSADATFPGLVSSAAQTFSGTKTFNAPILASPGTVSAPGIAFARESNTGIYHVGTTDFSFAVGGVQAIDVQKSNGGFGNIGMGGAASVSDIFPMVIQRTLSGSFLTVAVSNLSTDPGSSSAFEALVDNGANQAVFFGTSVATAVPDVYATGRAVVRATSGLSGVSYLADATDGNFKWYVAGGAVTNIPFLINSGGGYATTMMRSPIIGVGSVSFTSSASGAAYNVAWPGSQGSNLQVPINDGSGRLSWQFVNLSGAGVVGSVNLTNQVVGNLPLSQTSGSISLTNQVSGNLPLSQTQGSLSLTNQISGILPQGNLTLTPTFTQVTIGSITVTSSAGGAAYTTRWPGAQGGANTAQVNDGAGNLSWQAILTNPLTTGGDMIVSSGSGVATRLGISSTGFTLVTDTSQPLGVAWGNPRFIQQRTVGSNYTVLTTDQNIFVTCSANSTINLTLPTAIGNAGLKFYFQKIAMTSAADVVNIKAISSQTIKYSAASSFDLNIASTSFSLFTQGESIEILSDNTNWIALNHHSDTSWSAYTPTNTQGLGSFTASSFVWRRHGSDLLIRGVGVTGQTTASEAQVSFPFAFIPDANAIGSTSLVGDFVTNQTLAGSTQVIVDQNNTFLNFSSETGTNVALAKQTGANMAASTTKISFIASIPIRNWVG